MALKFLPSVQYMNQFTNINKINPIGKIYFIVADKLTNELIQSATKVNIPPRISRDQLGEALKIEITLLIIPILTWIEDYPLIRFI